MSTEDPSKPIGKKEALLAHGITAAKDANGEYTGRLYQQNADGGYDEIDDTHIRALGLRWPSKAFKAAVNLPTKDGKVIKDTQPYVPIPKTNRSIKVVSQSEKPSVPIVPKTPLWTTPTVTDTTSTPDPLKYDQDGLVKLPSLSGAAPTFNFKQNLLQNAVTPTHHFQAAIAKDTSKIGQALYPDAEKHGSGGMFAELGLHYSADQVNHINAEQQRLARLQTPFSPIAANHPTSLMTDNQANQYLNKISPLDPHRAQLEGLNIHDQVMYHKYLVKGDTSAQYPQLDYLRTHQFLPHEINQQNEDLIAEKDAQALKAKSMPTHAIQAIVPPDDEFLRDFHQASERGSFMPKRPAAAVDEAYTPRVIPMAKAYLEHTKAKMMPALRSVAAKIFPSSTTSTQPDGAASEPPNPTASVAKPTALTEHVQNITRAPSLTLAETAKTIRESPSIGKASASIFPRAPERIPVLPTSMDTAEEKTTLIPPGPSANEGSRRAFPTSSTPSSTPITFKTTRDSLRPQMPERVKAPALLQQTVSQSTMSSPLQSVKETRQSIADTQPANSPSITRPTYSTAPPLPPPLPNIPKTIIHPSITQPSITPSATASTSGSGPDLSDTNATTAEAHESNIEGDNADSSSSITAGPTTTDNTSTSDINTSAEEGKGNNAVSNEVYQGLPAGVEPNSKTADGDAIATGVSAGLGTAALMAGQPEIAAGISILTSAGEDLANTFDKPNKPPAPPVPVSTVPTAPQVDPIDSNQDPIQMSGGSNSTAVMNDSSEVI